MFFAELAESEFGRAKFLCRSFLQSMEMYRRYKSLGREVYLVGVKTQHKEILAAGLMVARPWHLGKKIFKVPGGWLMDYEAENYAKILALMTQGAYDFAKERAGIAIEITPNIVSQTRDINGKVVEGPEHLAVKDELVREGYKYLGEYEQAKWEFVLDFDGKTPEQLIAEFRTTHRQLIRKAEREGIRVRELDNQELVILKDIAGEAGERHGFNDPNLDYYRSMKEAFGDKAKFVVAEAPRGMLAAENLAGMPAAVVENEGGEVRSYVPIAAAMFINDGGEMVYLYSGSLRKLQKYNGAYAIQWRMINEAIESGCWRYNFYGTHPVEGNGVYRFKQGFRGVVLELLGAFILPIGGLGKLYAARIRPKELREVE